MRDRDATLDQAICEVATILGDALVVRVRQDEGLDCNGFAFYNLGHRPGVKRVERE